MIKVFIENEAGSNLKNIHDEKLLTYIETIEVGTFLSKEKAEFVIEQCKDSNKSHP